MTLRNLLFICFVFIFVIACGAESSSITESQTAESAEASGLAQDVPDEHSDEDSDEHSGEEGEHGAEDSDEHSDEEGEHGAEDADQHGDEEANEHRELGAHEHGVAELMIAWSGSDVAIDLETPAYNILGFEYAPTSDEEKALLDESVAALEAGGLLQLSPDAGCTLVSATVQTNLAEEGLEKEGHDSDGEGHDEEGLDTDEESHDEENSDEEKHDEEGHDEETHSDIDVSYNLECQAAENISSLDASNLFAQFPNFEDIQAQWISDTEQSATDLTPNNPVLTFN